MNIAKRKRKQKRSENMQECPVCGRATEHSMFIDGSTILMVCTKCGNQLEFKL